MKVSVVIVNFQTPQLTVNCLDALDKENSKLVQFNTFIVDNNSDDDSVKILEAWVKSSRHKNQHQLIAHTANNGFSSGNNIGIKLSDSEFILLLNSDTIVRPGVIDLLIKTLQNEPRMGIASPRLEWPDGSPQESCFRFHRPINELIRSAATGPITRLFKRYEVPLKVSDKVMYPEWTSFACVLIRRQVFEEIGLLDEGFFMYFEDVDFCKRTRDAGWNIIHNPEASVVHLGGGSSLVKNKTEKKERLPRYIYESRARFYYRYYGRFGLFRANIYWHLGAIIGIFRKLIDRSYQPNICEKQWRDIWINFMDPTAPYTHPDNY